ncbi:MAG: hypothetical protein ACLUEK_10815, partial [Oscillospiraceae bacterium]
MQRGGALGRVAERARRGQKAPRPLRHGPDDRPRPNGARGRARAGAPASRTTAYIFAALCLVAFGLGFVSAWAFIGAALFAGLAAWRFFAASKAAERARQASAERHRLLASWGAADERELLDAAREYEELCAASEKAAGAERRAGEALEEARARRSEAEARLFKELPPSESRREAERRCELLRASIAELGGAVAAMGDPWCWRAASSKSASIWRG